MTLSRATLPLLLAVSPLALHAQAANLVSVTAPSGLEARIADAKSAMMAEPDKALAHARAAARLANGLADPRARSLAIAQAQWLEGEALTRVNRPDEARPVIEAALRTAIAAEPRAKLHGDLLLSRAAIDFISGRVHEALAGSHQAYTIFERVGEARAQAKALQNIGTIYFEARDYPKVLKYYAQSAEVYKDDPALTIAALNNTGDAYKEMGQIDRAISDYRQAIKLAREIDSPVLEVRILNNMASAQVAAGAYALADQTADLALIRARGHGTGWEPYLWGVKAQAAFARNDLTAAERYLENTFADQDLAGTDLLYRDFHDTAFKLFEATGRVEQALAHLKAFKRLDDEVRDLAASTNSALMTAQFDFANQELRIHKLNRDRLERDIAVERDRAELGSMVLTGALSVGALLLAGTLAAFFSIRRSRNQVRDANRNLSEMNGELEKALSAKTRFLATTSHEIRTPLNGILGMTEVMLHDGDLQPVQRERVRIVHDAGHTMKALVDDILDVAKIEGGKLVLEQVEVELRTMLQRIPQLWHEQAAAKGLTVTADLGDAPTRIMGDERRLRQIVFNLMSNAVKFTASGSVALRAAMDGDQLVIEVSDTGIGIAPDHFATVFQSFQQIDGEVTRKFGGTGLGLAICQELAKAMGGKITVASELGLGSTFTVRLPVARCDEPSLEAEVDGGPVPWPDMASAKLLVIEPNPLTRSVIAATFRTIAGQVEAVAAPSASPSRYHHVVADLQGLSPERAVDQVAEFTARGAVVTLIVAEKPSADHFAALVRAGAAQLLQRPFSPADLVSAVCQAHEGRSASAPRPETEGVPCAAVA